MGSCCCCCCSKPIPSPKSTGVTSLTDEGAAYIQLPTDTKFVESCANNDAFQKDVIFIPLQRGDVGELYIYSANVGERTANLLYGPVKLLTPRKHMSDPDGAQELTPFGTALTSDGRLWICVFNHSLVVEMDLKTGEILNEVHVPAPNDVCIDPLDETVAYAAGGSQTTFCCCFTVTNATRGKIFKITKKSNGTASAGTLIRGLSTLAGIEKMDDELFSSVLYKMFKTKTESCLRSRVPVWRGPDDNDEVWLADNIQKFDKDTLVIPAYRTLGDTATCLFLGCRPISAIGNCAAQCLTCIAEGENCREAFRDPEVALEFSILDTDAPLRLFLLNKDGTAKHFSVDLVNARQIESTTEREFYFDSNVTNIAHVKDKLVCINFQQPRIMLLPDTPYLEDGPVSRL